MTQRQTEQKLNSDGLLTRRTFLTQSTAIVTGAAFMSGAPRAQSGSWQLRLSTSSIHFMGLPIEDACASIATLGFDAIDIWSAHAGCPHLDDVQRRLGPDGLKELLARHKLKLFAFSVYQGGYPRYAELLGKAGGGVAIRGSTKPCPPAQIAAKTAEFLESLKPEIELAEKYDSYLAIENHGHALLDSLDSFKAFADQNRSKRVGIALAPYHVQALGESVPEAIRIAGEQLSFFYAWQNAAGVQQLPGRGPADFVPWIEALAQARYRGYVNPFMHGELPPKEMFTELARSKAYLIQCHRQRQA